MSSDLYGYSSARNQMVHEQAAYRRAVREETSEMTVKEEVTADSALDLYARKLEELEERMNKIAEELNKTRAYGRLMKLEDVGEYVAFKKDAEKFKQAASDKLENMRREIWRAHGRVEYINENYHGAATRFEFLKKLDDIEIEKHLENFAESKAKIEVDVENALRISMELGSKADDIIFRGKEVCVRADEMKYVEKTAKVSAIISVCCFTAIVVLIGGIMWSNF